MAWSSNNNRPPSAAGGGCAPAVVVAGPGQGKAGKTGPGQTKPRQGTTGKPAKPKQDFEVVLTKARLVRQDGKTSLNRYSPKTSLNILLGLGFRV